MRLTRLPPPAVLAGSLIIGGLSVGSLANTANAQGFGLSEIGTCAIARGFAVTGATCKDPSVIFWNPAAAAKLPQGIDATVGLAAIIVNGGFRRDTTKRRYNADPPVEFPPNLFGTYNWDNKWSAGLGVYVPYGLTSQWKDDFPGRFLALKASLGTVYVQPNIAYAITPEWSVGIGPIWGHSSVTLDQALDLSDQVATTTNGIPITFGQLGFYKYTEFGRAKLKGSGNAWGFNLGVHGIINKDWVVGLRYLSELKFKYDNADVSFSQTPTGLQLSAANPLTGVPTPVDSLLAGQFRGNGPLVSQKGSSQITHPWQFQIGGGYTGLRNTTLSLDIARIGWSSFNTLPITFSGPAGGSNRVLLENYDDTWAIRAGGEYVLKMPGWWQDWAVRAGYSYAQTPAPDETVTPLLPDMDRRNFSIGLGIPIHKTWRVDAAYLYVNTGGRRGRITERTEASQTAGELNSGAYNLSAHVLSVNVSAFFFR